MKQNNTTQNPLLENFNNYPFISISLPTGGVFYDSSILDESVDPMEFEVGPFTMWDEVNWNNPYAIMSGKATNNIIKNVTQGVKNIDELCAVDIEAIFIASRQVSYGNIIEMDVTCENEECKKSSKISVRLDAVLLQYKNMGNLEQWQVEMPNGQVVQLKPVRYKDLIEFIKIAIEHKRKLEAGGDAEKLEEGFMEQMIEQQVNMMRCSVMYVQSASGVVVNNRQHINEWLDNLPSSWFKEIKEKSQEINEYNSRSGSVEHVCPYCEHKQLVNVIVDPTRFFGPASVA